MAQLDTAPDTVEATTGRLRGVEGLRPMGVYIHFPWCLVKCPYCDFVAHRRSPDRIEHKAYADAVLAELAHRLARLDTARWGLTSVFFGGGTPSLWDPRELGRVLRAVLSAFGPWPSARSHASQLPALGEKAGLADVRNEVEVSVECDPVGFDEDAARALLDVGVRRLSLGVQGFDDARLAFLGRAHDAGQAKRAVEAAVRAGVPHLAADLIHGIPGLAPEAAAADASQAVELGATHISAYGLTIEPATVFGKLARQGRLPLVEDAVSVDSFFAIDQALARLGLDHYEISNYAALGHRSIHNVGYWLGHEYLGLGTGAVGMLDDPEMGPIRYRNVPHPQRYLDAIQAIPSDCRTSRWSDIEVEHESLEPATRLRERIMLGLRMSEGLDLVQAASACGAEPWPAERRKAARALEERGRIVREGDRIRIPKKAWTWTDATAAALF